MKKKKVRKVKIGETKPSFLERVRNTLRDRFARLLMQQLCRISSSLP